MSLKNDIRNATIGAKDQFKTKEFDYEGTVVKFKQLSLRQRNGLIKKATGPDGELDNTLFSVYCVIEMTVDEKGDQVFSNADKDALLDSPAGGFVDTFTSEAISVMDSGKEGDKGNPTES